MMQNKLLLKVLGSGDAFGSGGRFNTCFLVRAESQSFLIDCGSSSMIAMRHFKVDPNTIDAIVISHFHADHFGGLPYFILDAQLVSRRTRPLVIAGPPRLEKRLAEMMEASFPGSSLATRKFSLELIELDPSGSTEVNGIRVSAAQVLHAAGDSPTLALRCEIDGKIIAYTADTEWVDSLVEIGRMADVFIAEAYYFDKKVRYHLDLSTILENIPRIMPRCIVLTHMSSGMLDKPSAVGCVCAYDGFEMEI